MILDDIDWLNGLRSDDDKPLNMFVVRVVDRELRLVINDHVCPRHFARDDIRQLARIMGIGLVETWNGRPNSPRTVDKSKSML